MAVFVWLCFSRFLWVGRDYLVLGGRVNIIPYNRNPEDRKKKTYMWKNRLCNWTLTLMTSSVVVVGGEKVMSGFTPKKNDSCCQMEKR